MAVTAHCVEVVVGRTNLREALALACSLVILEADCAIAWASIFTNARSSVKELIFRTGLEGQGALAGVMVPIFS